MNTYNLTNSISVRTISALLAVTLLIAALPVALIGKVFAQATTGSITTEEFVAVDGSYKGISVGFRTENFGTAQAVSVALERADGSVVTKTANSGVLSIINQDTSGGDQLTVPFVIEEGSFTEASDATYWNPAPATWNTNTRPVEVTISVTDENGDVVAVNSTFNDGDPSWPTYESLLPPMPEVTATNFNTHSGSDYEGINVGFTLNTEFENVTDVRVALFNDAGIIVENTHNQMLLDLINDGETSLSTPFIMTQGSYIEEYWNLGSNVWTSEDKPTRVVISVTDETGTYTDENTNFSEPNGWTYESLVPPAPTPETTVIISGDTAGGENQPGWLFNRDTSTMTPFEFNTVEASIGDGSLYVFPIGTSSSDKFIGELFLNDTMSDIVSISYDYMLGNNSATTTASANQFYANVYANFDDSDDFGHCVYNVVPNNGTAGWHTVTFDPEMDYDVRQRGTEVCPASPSDMGPDAELRAFAINLGDTTDTDEGLDGYFDNVVVETTDMITTYDFEPTPAPTTGGGGGGGRLLESSGGSNQNDDDEDEDEDLDDAPEGEVLGASDSVGTCGMYLEDYIGMNTHTASVWETMKLQLFLLSKNLYVADAGVFDTATETEVRRYQADNASAILQPWVTAGLADTLPPTGKVYKTTRWHINNAVCPGSESFPVLP